MTTTAQLQAAVNALIAHEPRFASVYQHTGLPTLRVREAGFLQLYHAIVAQQISVAAANSIWQRIIDSGYATEAAVLAADSEQLRTLGLSRQKVRYVQSLAQHQIDYAALAHQSDKDVIDTLTAVTGIGRWTAEIYCLFSLNRSDIFAANDLALQVAAQHALDLPARPKEAQLRKIAQAWSPYRSAAAYLLWAYYRVVKQRDGVV